MKAMKPLPLFVALLLLLLGGCDAPTTAEEELSWLGEANPNPVHIGDSTTIEYGISAGDSGYMIIRNCMGQLVRVYAINEGTSSFVWNGRDSEGRVCASGVYYYTLQTNNFSETRKLVLIR